jgi:hypothetical protein
LEENVMKVKMLVLVVAMTLVAATAQSALWSTPLDNPSFESVENGGTPGGWGYIIDDWYENESPDMFSNFYEKGGPSGIGLVGDGDIWVGTETGGMFYQPIGTYDGDETINITLLMGNRWGNSFVTGGISLYAGGLESGAADGVDLSSISGVVQLATTTITIGDGTLVSTDVYEVSVDLSTGLGITPGELLWLEIGSVEGKDYFDHVRVTPEPATMILLGLGGLCLRRRKR